MNVLYSKNEMHEYFVKLHKQIHWLLVYKEKEYQGLLDYFDYVLFQLNGLRSFVSNDYRVIHLLILIESAKIESQKTDYNHVLYRRAILDAHGIITSLEGGVENE